MQGRVNIKQENENWEGTEDSKKNKLPRSLRKFAWGYKTSLAYENYTGNFCTYCKQQKKLLNCPWEVYAGFPLNLNLWNQNNQF